jgi:hypothetical protein
MEVSLRKESLSKTDEAWLVVDKDDWTDGQFRELQQWTKKNINYGLALSNPNFEYWLLLHFEDGKKIANSHECLMRLKKHLPNYKKDIDNKKFTLELIKRALERAKQRDIHQGNALPQIWSTSVYRLVEKILNSK